MLVDAERVLVELKAALTEKPSWGADQLLSRIGRLEAEHRIESDEFEAYVRLHAHHFIDSFMGLFPHETEAEGPTTDDGATSPVVASTPHLRTTPKSEAPCQTPLAASPSATSSPLALSSR